MKELLEQLSTEIISAVGKVEPQTVLVHRFREVIIPDVNVKAVDLVRGLKAIPVSQTNHPAQERVEELSNAVYPLADLRWKNYLTGDEIRAWEKVEGGLQQALADKVARGIVEISKTQEVLLSQALAGAINYSQFPSGSFSVGFGSPNTGTWTATDILGTIEDGINILSEKGYGGKLYLFCGKNRFADVLADSKIQTLIQGQAIAVGVLTGQSNLNILGVEVVFAGVSITLPDGSTTKLIADNNAFLVSEDAVVNVYGIPNLANGVPTRYQPVIAFSERDLQGIEILVASRYLPVVFPQGVVMF